jgi:DNA-binding NtrC family response regulator
MHTTANFSLVEHKGNPNYPAPELGVSPEMREIQLLLRRLARHDANILLSGESGVGKEYAARYFHRNAEGGNERPFIPVNCAALSDTLLEAELFGHEKGAFTGAATSHRGIFEQAHGGTLFLDEIGEMSPRMQAKLLRAIQERKIQRVGGEVQIPVQVRLICATNCDIKAQVEEKTFREDLFFRINVVNIPIPPIRERQQDIIWFAHRFTEEYSQRNGLSRELSPAGESYLLGMPWPGNLRELQNTIERACILAEQETLGPLELGAEFEGVSSVEEAEANNGLKGYLQQCEAKYIHQALSTHRWRITETAASLGISRKNLWEKMRKHGIQARD